MNISLNLDDYLKQFSSLNFCDDLLKAYYEERDSDTVLDSRDNEIFAYRTEPSQEHYRTLLNEEYNTIYNLVTLHIPTDESDLSWSDWYYVASNAYKMKGVLASFQYVLDYLNMDPRVEGNITYEHVREGEVLGYEDGPSGNDYNLLEVHVPVSSRNADLTRNYLEKLARELLIVDSITASFTDLEFDINIKFTSSFTSHYNVQKSTVVNFWDCGVKNVIRRPIITGGRAIEYIDTTYKELYNVLEGGTVEKNVYRIGNMFNPFLTWANLQRINVKIPNVVIDFVKQVRPEIDLPEMRFVYKARELYKITPVYGRKDIVRNQNISDYQFRRKREWDLITISPLNMPSGIRMTRRGPVLGLTLGIDDDDKED